MFKVFDSWKCEYIETETVEEALQVRAQLIDNYIRDNMMFPIAHVQVTEEGEVWAACDERGNRIAN